MDQLDQPMDNSVTSAERSRKRAPLGAIWSFTLNNWKDQELTHLDEVLKNSEWPAAVGQEVGDNGTPHLQCWVNFGKRKRPTEMEEFRKLRRIHWGDEHGKPQRTKNVVEGPTYCCKDGDFQLYNGAKRIREIRFPPMNQLWELQILQIIQQEPDDRTIYWYWSEKGNIGKTTFSKYLTAKHGALPLSGRGHDCRNGIAKYYENNGVHPEILVFPIPMSYNSEYLSYEAIETCKDMYFYSGKYEGAPICGPCPHLFVFANFAPDESKMAIDRWKIHQID